MLPDETKAMLDQVKKGKTRKFVMLTKGTSIVSLVLYKKGAPTKYIKEAKESGKGTPCFGVLEGGGLELVVKLAATDGFKDAPVKDLVLKKYLEDEAGFKCKPRFEIVEALPIVLDEADPLHARFLALQERAVETCDLYPDRAEEIGTLCRQTGGYLDAEQRDKATDKLEALEDLLDSLGKKTVDKHEESYRALKAKLEPLLQKAVSKAPDKASSFSKIWDYALAQADEAKFTSANKALAGLADAITKLLASGSSPSSSSSSTTTSDSGTIPTAPPMPPSSTTGTTDDEDEGEEDDEEEAEGEVDLKADAEFLARWQGARVRWLDAVEEVDGQLVKLAAALRNSDDGDLWEIAEFGMNAVTDNHKVPLQAALLDVERVAPAKRRAAVSRALKRIDAFVAHLKTDDRVAVCDDNPFDVKVSLRGTLGTALQFVASVLKTAA
jgi:ElaB/YqjD/DUF883 family membrane-anchored ribosome-binding protein